MIEYNTLFLVKARLEVNPIRALISGLFITVGLSSYLMFITERGVGYEDDLTLESRHRIFHNTLWIILITVLTVGYGDLYPIMDTGSIIAICAGFGGLLLSAALITMIHKYLTLS